MREELVESRSGLSALPLRPGTLLFGILAIFSIGPLLIVASVPLIMAAVRQPVPRRSRLATAGAVHVVSLVGLRFTAHPVSCPSDNLTGGGYDSGFLTGGYTWSCVDGKLTVGPATANPNSGTTPR